MYDEGIENHRPIPALFFVLLPLISIGNRLCLSIATVFVSCRSIEQPGFLYSTPYSQLLLRHNHVLFFVTYIWHLFLSLLFSTHPNRSWRVWFCSLIKCTSQPDWHKGPLTAGNHPDSSQRKASSWSCGRDPDSTWFSSNKLVSSACMKCTNCIFYVLW